VIQEIGRSETMKQYLSLWRNLISVRSFPSLFSALYEILCKRNVVKSKFSGTRHGEGIALFYGRKSNDTDACAVKLYGRLKATP
jgi:hypothetical protein